MKKTDDAWLRKSLILAGLMALAGSMSACVIETTTTTGGGGPYLQPWYDVYGNQCGSGAPHAGCDFYWDGTQITAGADPYYSNAALMTYATWSYTDPYGYSQYYTGYAWLSPDGILYDSNGYALNEADDNSGGRDLIGDVATQEQQVVTQAGKAFASKYALSEATGINIARTLNDWATLSKKQQRARTAQDVADFSRRLYGVTVDKAVNALNSAKNGDLSGMIQVNSDIATYWGTSPETSKTILKNWYKDQLSDFNVH